LDAKLDLHGDTIQTSIILEQPFVVPPESSLYDVLVEMKSERHACVYVSRNGKLLGLISERDVLRILAEGKDLSEPVESIMTSPVDTVEEECSVADTIRLMWKGGYRRLPVVDSSEVLLGTVSVKKILHYLVEHFPNAVYNLPPDPHAVMQEREGG